MRLPKKETPARVPKYVLVVAGLVIAGTLAAIPARVLNSYEVNQRVLVLEQRLAVREEENAALQQELARRGTTAYVRMVAKERLGLVEPGEELVLLPLEANSAQQRLERTSVPVQDRGITVTPYDAEWGYFLEWLALLRQSFS